MSRRSMPYHRRYHQDALQGYRKLDLEQRGAYSTILDLIYDEGGPIDYNERWLAGELNCTVGKARKLISQLIELRKIYLTSNGKISNHRCEQEIEKSRNFLRSHYQHEPVCNGCTRQWGNRASGPVFNRLNYKRLSQLAAVRNCLVWEIRNGRDFRYR